MERANEQQSIASPVAFEDLLSQLKHRLGSAKDRSVNNVLAQLGAGNIRYPSHLLPSHFSPLEARVSTKAMYASLFPFPDEGIAGVFTADVVWLESASGNLLHKKTSMFSSFQGAARNVFWSPYEKTYFLGYLLWNIFSMPFSLLELPSPADPIKVQALDTGEGYRIHAPVPQSPDSRAQVKIDFDSDLRMRQVAFTVPILKSCPWATAILDRQGRSSNSPESDAHCEVYWRDPDKPRTGEPVHLLAEFPLRKVSLG